MGFSSKERRNLNSKVLAAGVKDANEIAQWYETRFPNAFVSRGDKVWTDPDLQLLLDNPAATVGDAQGFAAGVLNGIIEDYSLAANAIRLSVVPGSNSSTYVAYDTFGDFSSDQLDNWVQPQFVLKTDGAPSQGYAIRLFEGDPNAGGTEILVTDGTTGTGIDKTVGWIFDYSNGMLLLSEDFRASVTDPYILGFKYIGSTAQEVVSSIGQQQETLPVTFNGQTNFILSSTPVADGYVMMFVNGQKQQYGADYTNTGNSVDYTGAFSLVTTDVVEFFYLAELSGASNINFQTLGKTLETGNTTDGYDIDIVGGSAIDSSDGVIPINVNGINALTIDDDTVNTRFDGYVLSWNESLGANTYVEQSATSNEIELVGEITTVGDAETLIVSYTPADDTAINIHVKFVCFDGTDAAVFNIQGGFLTSAISTIQLGTTELVQIERGTKTWEVGFNISAKVVEIFVKGDLVSTINWKALARILKVD